MGDNADTCRCPCAEARTCGGNGRRTARGRATTAARARAGAGFLGEVAADGTREVGVFWSEATGWPLVHDEDGETAIQSPDGGVKIAWGGPPLNPQHDRNRMHFVLGADDLDTEVDRLVALGASVVERGHDEVEMADPDGNEFRLRG